jgi:hypothetical protein
MEKTMSKATPKWFYALTTDGKYSVGNGLGGADLIAKFENKECTDKCVKAVNMHDEMVELLEKLQSPSNKAFLSIELGNLSKNLLQKAKAST